MKKWSTRTVVVRFSPAELREVRRAAKLTGKSLHESIRDAAVLEALRWNPLNASNRKRTA